MNLSDALRGAADRAPLDQVSVDVAGTARRTARHRGLRTGANALVAAGAVALVAVAVVGPGSALDADTSAEAPASLEGSDTYAGDGAAEDAGVGASAEGAGDEAASLAAGSSLAWGLCGQPLPEMPDTDLGTLTASVGVDTVKGGGAIPISVTLTPSTTSTVDTFGPTAVVLWEGIVVASGGAVADAALSQETLDPATPRESSVEQPLVNCWDGAPLPAAEYTVVASEELWPVAEPPATAEPGEAAEPGEPGEPGDSAEPSAVPVPEEGAGVDGAASSPAAAAGIRLVADPVTLTVAGDPVKDPFAAYLGGVAEPEPAPVDPGLPVAPVEPSLPEGALTPETARSLFEEGRAGAWDMAAGSQRWIITADSQSPDAYQWWGCAEGAAFPRESAQMDLLAVDVAAPSTIDVSYGWVVEDNPLVSTTVTNTSAWDLVDFWGMTNLNLALVRDGAVVAEAYPIDPRQHMATAELSAALTLPSGTSSLEAGASHDHDFLWRDVSACWADDAPATVEPGTYTLLSMHTLSVGSYGTVAVGGALTGDAMDARLALEEQGLPDAAATDAEAYDAVEFQVWTSLGQVTVR